MNATAREARDLADAATVHAAREGVVHALAPLAASPLDEQAAARMRQALAKADSPGVREALRRLVATPRRSSQRPTLSAVPSPAGGDSGPDRLAPTNPIPSPHPPTEAPAGDVA